MRAFAILTALVLLDGCHREEPDYYAWERLLESGAPITVDVARKAFVLAFAPLPGVDRPPGKDQIIPDGTLVLEWMDGFISELTPEQLAVYEKLNVEAPMPIGAPVNKTITPEIKGWIDQATTSYQSMTGVTPPKIEPYVSTEYAGTQVLAFARPKDAGGKQEGPVVRCRVGLPEKFFVFYGGSLDGKLLAHETLAHEIFHCFEYPSFPKLAARHPSDAWILEGAATWASIKLLGSASGYQYPWKLALEKSERPLFLRTYDALGFFFQLVTRRYERGSILLTSNQPVIEWGNVFGDEMIAAAVLDRLLHHSHNLVIRGESYRLKQQKKAGLLGSAKRA